MSVLPSLVIPLALGAMMYMGLSAAIQNDWIANEQILRYLTGHPISQLTTAMFFVGGASVLLIALNIFEQFRWEPAIQLPHSESDSRAAANQETNQKDAATEEIDARVLYLDSLPKKVHDHYLWNRLDSALQFVERTGSATNVDEELKYLSDNDHHAQTQRYSLVRILIWAMPMLGFLGTVLGISQALGGLNFGADKDFADVMGGLQASLYVAFDTTAVALTLSIALMFCTFFVERFELQLLDHVDLRARKEIADQFDFTGKPDSAVQTIERIGKGVLVATHDVVMKQAELWKATIDQAESAWITSSTETHDALQESMSGALDEAMLNMAHLLAQAIGKADESLATRWEQWQITMSDNARQLTLQQESLHRHAGLLKDLFQQMENLGQYQTALNRNLEALTITGRLDETLSNLDKVIGELNKKLIRPMTADEAIGKKKTKIRSVAKSTKSAPVQKLADEKSPDKSDKSFLVRIAEGTARAA